MTDAVTRLRAALADLKRQGEVVVTINSLESYLSTLAAAGDGSPMDAEMAKARFEYQNAANLEMFKSVIEAGRTALNALILMNGGATVALLAFLGNAKSPATPFSAQSITRAMLYFVLGVGCAGVSLALRYLSQFLGHGRAAKAGLWMTYLAIVVGLGSLGFFFAGGLQAHAAF